MSEEDEPSQDQGRSSRPECIDELLAAGDYEKAVTLLQAQLKTSPSDQIRRRLAEVMEEQGDKAGAIAALAAIEERKPGDTLAEGRLFLAQWKLPEAHGKLEGYVKSAPDSACGYYYLAYTEKYLSQEKEDLKKQASGS